MSTLMQAPVRVPNMPSQSVCRNQAGASNPLALDIASAGGIDAVISEVSVDTVDVSCDDGEAACPFAVVRHDDLSS